MENIYSCVGDLVYGFCESARFRMRLNVDVLYIQTNPGTYLVCKYDSKAKRAQYLR